MKQTKNYQGTKVTYPRFITEIRDTGADENNRTRITAAGNRSTEPPPPPRSPFVYTLVFRKAWEDLINDNSSGPNQSRK